MQETPKNYFWSKKRNTTLRQAKTGKHECQDVTETVIQSFLKTPVCRASLSLSFNLTAPSLSIISHKFIWDAE